MINFNEVDRKNAYYKIIQMSGKYTDDRNFPIDKVVVSDKKVNLKAENSKEMGGFCISDFEHIFRWIIRGDTLCKVIIPDDSHIYRTESNNGIYVADKIILTNPILIDDNCAMNLYENSNLPEDSYFKALAACCIKGYKNTAIRVLKDKLDKSNQNIAIKEFEEFCKRRENEYGIKTFELELVKLIHNRLKECNDFDIIKYRNGYLEISDLEIVYIESNKSKWIYKSSNIIEEVKVLDNDVINVRVFYNDDLKLDREGKIIEKY